MGNDEDYISVGQDFIYDNPMTNNLVAGVVEVKGNFIQKNQRGWQFGNFSPSGTNKFLLSGEQVQNITFASAPYSRFNTLILTKPLSTGYKLVASGNFYNQLEQLKPVSIQSVSSNLTGLQPTNSSITLTANASGGIKRLYEFWVWKEGENPKIVREYSSDKSFVWKPTELGNYVISVHVKDIKSTKRYDAVKRYNRIYSIGDPVKINSITANFPSPQKINIPIEIKTDAVGGNGLLYEYWVWKIGENAKVVRPYTVESTYRWQPTEPGDYIVSVHVKDKYSIRSYDQFKRLAIYRITN
jgi:hypothetical protein